MPGCLLSETQPRTTSPTCQHLQQTSPPPLPAQIVPAVRSSVRSADASLPYPALRLLREIVTSNQVKEPALLRALPGLLPVLLPCYGHESKQAMLMADCVLKGMLSECGWVGGLFGGVAQG
jgi:hypothetical protein